jgi:FAD/FMN-containing dehydrogenase
VWACPAITSLETSRRIVQLAQGGAGVLTERRLQEIAGEDHVSAAPSTLDAYARDESFVGTVRPQFVVKAASADVVQALVNEARQTRTPLVPISSGAPHFHGDTVPAGGDAVVVDLSGMKKIDWIDRTERVAAFEPGVTFGELIPAVAKEGLRLNVPLRPRATKSVIGSMLSREPVIMPRYHWDVGDPLGSTEVVFGTGERFRTGAAAGPGSIEEQRQAGGAQKEAAGPSTNSWHRIIQGAQGTMGIVTWASARCEVLPDVEESFFAGSSDPAKLVEAMRWLVRLKLADECFLLSGSQIAALCSDSPEAYAALQAELPPWALFYNLAASGYFPEDRMRGQTLDTRDLMQKVGIASVRSLAGIAASRFLDEARQPCPGAYWKLQPRGGCQDIFFVTTYDKIAGLLSAMTQVASNAGCSALPIGTYLQPVVQGTSCHCEFSVFYDPESSAETKAVRALVKEAVNPLMAAGAFFSRPFGEVAPGIMNRDAASVALLKKVKEILDPAGILNPGRLCF